MGSVFDGEMESGEDYTEGGLSPVVPGLINGGMDSEEAQQVVVEVEQGSRAYKALIKKIRVVRRLEKDLLDTWTGFSEKSDSLKREILWKLGMDTESHNYHVVKNLARGDIGTEIVYKKFVVGQERIDEEYLSMRDRYGNYISSEEAREYKKELEDDDWRFNGE